jgi:hypothetical protein
MVIDVYIEFSIAFSIQCKHVAMISFILNQMLFFQFYFICLVISTNLLFLACFCSFPFILYILWMAANAAEVTKKEGGKWGPINSYGSYITIIITQIEQQDDISRYLS